jgi:hypothetical protein
MFLSNGIVIVHEVVLGILVIFAQSPHQLLKVPFMVTVSLAVNGRFLTSTVKVTFTLTGGGGVLAPPNLTSSPLEILIQLK